MRAQQPEVRWAQIGRNFGVDHKSVMRHFVIRGRDRIVPVGMTPSTRVAREVRRASAEALMNEIPEDTRSLTASLMGDPLPGRSALDRELA